MESCDGGGLEEGLFELSRVPLFWVWGGYGGEERGKRRLLGLWIDLIELLG